MKKDIKPFLFFSIIASLLVGHLANRTALIFEGLTGNLVENINAAIDAIIPALQNNPFMIGTSKTALISGAIGAACVWLIFLYNVFGAKNFMRGSEHGSARWGTAKDIKPLTALKMYFSYEYSIKEITAATGISKPSLYEYVRKEKQEREPKNAKE